MLPASQARLPIYDAGVVQGATVSELTRTFRRQPWRLGDHLDRLFRALEYARMPIDLSKADLVSISGELVEHNARLLPHADDELGLIQFVTAGEYPTYAGMSGRPVRTTPTVCAHTFPLPFEMWAAKMQAGARLVTPSIRQVPPECVDSQIKCRSRMHYYLADQEARTVDPDASALLLDLDGNITETSTANFLIVQSGCIVSPRSRSILPGISRRMVIELASESGIPFAERDLRVEEALAADEAFLTSTPYCLMSVTQLNGAPIGGGQPGAVAARLLAAWNEKVGLDIARQIDEGSRRRAAGGK
jgi:branched-subunit amino acid aminotransferase/4-amino-4-deoxychorismate lyase